MFVSQARSITQQSRLAITLAWIAGYTNILTLIICGTATSHISGTLSQWGRDLVEGKWSLTLFTSFLLITFLLGAVFSGLCTEGGRRRGWESIYVLPMAFQLVFLALFAILIELNGDAGRSLESMTYVLTGVASFAMGLQNATITRISGGVVRTTHMTGVFTDLGIELVHTAYWIRDRYSRPNEPGAPSLLTRLRSQPSAMRVVLLLSVSASFALGAGLGAIAWGSIPRWSMFPPVLFLLWIIYQDITLPISNIAPAQLVGETMGLPREIAVFHVRKRGKRRRVERLPDLNRWVERLPPSLRVVVLDFGDDAKIDEDASLELAAMIRTASQRQIRIVLAGIGQVHYRTMQQAGLGATLDVSTLCPDLELAIARAFTLLPTSPRHE